MYAIIQTGGKQYRVEKGDHIEVERLTLLDGMIEFNEILMLSDGEKRDIGTPFLTKVFVKGEVVGETKGAKVISFKYKRRKNYRRKVGHRQKYTVVRITAIERG